jgi:hypothetical protein
MQRTTIAISLTVASLAFASPAFAQNLLVNPGFDTPSGPELGLVHSGYLLVGESAADEWYVFHNTPGDTKTELVRSEISDGYMLRVDTHGPSNGIEHILGAPGTGPVCVTHGAWIYLKRGSIFIGAGNGGSTGPDRFYDTLGEWEYVEATNTTCPVSLFIVYAAEAGGAEFYIEKASVEEYNCIGPEGDFNADGQVNAEDLSILLGSWGVCSNCVADINGDGIVGGFDLAIVLANWGC